MAKTINESFEFEGWSPEEIYQVFTDSKKLTELTGYDTKIGKNTGDDFMALNGGVKGQILHMVPGRMIVASWRWLVRRKELADSILVMVFNGYEGGTKIEVSNANLPEDEQPFMNKDNFWNCIRDYMNTEMEKRRAAERKKQEKAKEKQTAKT